MGSLQKINAREQATESMLCAWSMSGGCRQRARMPRGLLRLRGVRNLLSVFVLVPLLGLCPGDFSASEASAQAVSQGDAVTVAIDGLIFEEPDDRSRVVLRVRAGERLKVISEREGWVRVQLPRGTGWVLEKIVRRDGESSKLAGFGDGQGLKVTVVDDYADIKAGPGDAYLGIKRVFQGDTFVVKEQSADGTWLRVQVGRDLGWIQANQVIKAEAVFERDRREPSIKPEREDRGSSRLSDSDEIEMEVAVMEQSDRSDGVVSGLTLRLGGMLKFTSQSFDSNSSNNRLDLYETGSTQFGFSAAARLELLEVLHLNVNYAFAQGLPIQVAFDEADAELKNSTHRLELLIGGGYAWDDAWVGLVGGWVYHRFNIQETTIPLFVPNSYSGVRLGPSGQVSLGPVSLWGGGWVVFGGALDQGETTSGETDSTTWFGAEAGVAVPVTDGLSIFGMFSLDRYKTVLKGEATRAEDITEAVNRDQFIGLTFGVHLLLL